MISLQEAQRVIAREYGFDDWQKLALQVDPASASPDPHPRMIVPPEWRINTEIHNENGGRAMSNDVWAMLTACCDGDLERVREMLDEDPQLIRCEYNYTQPVHFAVREGHVALTRLLLERGANPSYRTYFYRDSLLTMARDRHHAEIAEMISAALTDQLPIAERADEMLRATAAGNRDELTALLAAEPTLVNTCDDPGRRPSMSLATTAVSIWCACCSNTAPTRTRSAPTVPARFTPRCSETTCHGWIDPGTRQTKSAAAISSPAICWGGAVHTTSCWPRDWGTCMRSPAFSSPIRRSRISRTRVSFGPSRSPVRVRTSRW